MLVYASRFWGALLSTIIIEAIIVLFICYFLKKDFRIAIISVLGNVCTVPYAWFVFPAVFWYSSHLVLITGESFAFLLEAVLYKYLGKLNWKMALMFSLLANVASYLLWRFL
jgi:hypothetical protein